MTGTRVPHVEHSKKSRDPSFEHLRIYGRNLPIKKHIPNTLVGVIEVSKKKKGRKTGKKISVEKNSRKTFPLRCPVQEYYGRHYWAAIKKKIKLSN